MAHRSVWHEYGQFSAAHQGRKEKSIFGANRDRTEKIAVLRNLRAKDREACRVQVTNMPVGQEQMALQRD